MLGSVIGILASRNASLDFIGTSVLVPLKYFGDASTFYQEKNNPVTLNYVGDSLSFFQEKNNPVTLNYVGDSLSFTKEIIFGWSELTAPTLSLWAGNLVTAPNGNIVGLGYNNTGSYPAYRYLSTDGGLTWSNTAQGVNAEYRATATGADRIVVIASNSYTSNKCAVSTDNGNTFTHYSNMPSSTYWYALAYGNDKFIAGAYSNGTLATSVDGVTWGTQSTLMSGVDCLEYTNGIWIAGSRNTSGIHRSIDNGVTWSPVTVPGAAPIRASTANGKFFIANSGVSTTGLYYSTDAITWNNITLPISMAVFKMHFIGAYYVALGWTSGSQYWIIRSTDLITWQVQSFIPSSGNFAIEAPLSNNKLVSNSFREGKVGLIDLDTITTSSHFPLRFTGA